MYIQEDICIVHLSDLHIQSESNDEAVLTLSLQKMINDMIEFLFCDKCIIVVSGDTINKANYSSVNIETVLLFFKTIKEKFEKKKIEIKEIIFCPGNHDIIKDKGTENYDKLKKLMTKGPDDNKEKEEEITNRLKVFNSSGYQEYLKMINKVRNIFKFKQINCPFYCLSTRINEYAIHFITIDLAWNQASEELCNILKNNIEKFAGLSLGKYQLNSLRSDFHKLKKNESDLVVVVSHYPLSWLKFSDYQLFLSNLLSPSNFHANIYLCGHVHDNDAVNYTTHEHSLLTLVTGVGGQKERETWYSVYEINPIRNSCEIVARKSTNDSDFVFDFSVYTKDSERKSGKILYPLRLPQKNLPYLQMNTPNRFCEKNYFISSDISHTIPSVANCISKIYSDVSFHFSEMITNLLLEPVETLDNGYNTIISNEMIKKYFTNVLFSSYNSDEIRQFIELFLTNQVDENGGIEGVPKGLTELLVESWEKYCLNEPVFFLEGRFDTFMQEICSSYHTHLANEIFDKNISIRPHSRLYCKEDDSYKCNAFATRGNDYDTSSNISDIFQQREIGQPKDIKYGGLIEQAYKLRKPLIYSANAEFNVISTDWQEFITVIPDYEYCELEFNKLDNKNKKKVQVKRPAITFGISVKDCDQNQLYKTSRLFAIFDYLNLQADLSNWIANFDYYFGLPWKE